MLIARLHRSRGNGNDAVGGAGNGLKMSRTVLRRLLCSVIAMVQAGKQFTSSRGYLRYKKRPSVC